MSKLEKILLGLVAIVIIALFVHDRYLQYKLDNQPSPLSKLPVSSIVKTVTTYVDSSGRRHVVIPEKANTITETQAKLKGTLGILDTASLALDIAKNKIDQVTKANIQLAQENIVLKGQRDSIKKKTTYIYKDKYLNLSAAMSDTSSNLVASYLIDADINWVDYSKRKWLLGSRVQYTDLFSNNKNVKITGMERVTIEHAPSEFGLRLKLSSGYNFKTNGLSFGPGAEVDLGRFNFSGFYLKNFATGVISPVARIDYNLYSF